MVVGRLQASCFPCIQSIPYHSQNSKLSFKPAFSHYTEYIQYIHDKWLRERDRQADTNAETEGDGERGCGGTREVRMSDIIKVRWFILSASFWNVNVIPYIERCWALASSSSSSDAAAAFVVAVPMSFQSCWLFNTHSSNDNTANGKRKRRTGRGENCETVRSTAEREQEVKHWLEKGI